MQIGDQHRDSLYAELFKDGLNVATEINFPSLAETAPFLTPMSRRRDRWRNASESGTHLSSQQPSYQKLDSNIQNGGFSTIRSAVSTI